jgi:hypothetical protein
MIVFDFLKLGFPSFCDDSRRPEISFDSHKIKNVKYKISVGTVQLQFQLKYCKNLSTIVAAKRL